MHYTTVLYIEIYRLMSRRNITNEASNRSGGTGGAPGPGKGLNLQNPNNKQQQKDGCC